MELKESTLRCAASGLFLERKRRMQSKRKMRPSERAVWVAEVNMALRDVLSEAKRRDFSWAPTDEQMGDL